MSRPLLAACIAFTLIAPPPAWAGEEDSATPETLAGLAQKLAPSLVRVEFTAQYDKGESPGTDRWQSYLMSQQGGSWRAWEGWDQLIKEERPAQRGGFLLSPTRVYTADPMLHPRFLKSINVRFKDQVVSAKTVAWGRNDSGLVLELAAPLKDAVPLAFDRAKPAPYFAVNYDRHEAAWFTSVAPMRTSVVSTSDQRRYIPGNAHTLIVDGAATPIGIAGNGDFPLDDSWKGSPLQWTLVTADELSGLTARLGKLADSALLRVTITLRSPSTADGAESMMRYRYHPGNEDETATEWNGTAALVDDHTLLVLAKFDPKVTARLERIRVFTATGEEVEAAFAGTLKEWGALLARVEKPLPGAARFSAAAITDHRDKLLLKAEVAVHGETRTAYYDHERISSFYTGHHDGTYPYVSPVRGDSYGRYESGDGGGLNFLYDLDGALVALPLEHREKVTARQGYDSSQVRMTPVTTIAAVLKDTKTSLDPENRPLTEAEEHRLAWLGVELQGMDPDLARANNVSEQTNGGHTGGIVTYLYPNSPAAAAGLQVGDILLRLHVQGQPQPLEVEVEDHGPSGMMEQFWQYLDRMPDEAFDQMPKPWGNVENTLTRSLTDLGFGTPFTAEVFTGGKVVSKNFVVTQSPAHYDAAPRHKSEELGVTVRDMTYEVSRYFQIKEGEPGVIISKVERGSKAAVAGLKPFETVRTINDKSVRNVGDFEAIVKEGGELRLAVKRMTQGRTVKIKLDGPPAAAGAPAGKPAEAAPAPAGRP